MLVCRSCAAKGPHPSRPATPSGRYFLESGQILANFQATMFEYISSRNGLDRLRFFFSFDLSYLGPLHNGHMEAGLE